jgi:hypothetical protein
VKLTTNSPSTAELRSEAIKALREHKDEPVIDKSAAIRIATALGWEPKREWVGMTFDEFAKLMPYCHNEFDLQDFQTFAAAIEAKLKEKNT